MFSIGKEPLLTAARPPKWGLVNFDASTLWVRNRKLLTDALDITPEQAAERLSAAGMPTPRASAASSLNFGAGLGVFGSGGRRLSSTGASEYSSQTETETDADTDADTVDEERYRRFPLPPDRLER